MPLIDITNPDVIKFLVESYDKTARLRMKWNSLYGEKLKEAATLQREEKGYFETDVLKEAMAAGMLTITRDHKSGFRNRRQTPIRDGLFIPTTAHLRKGHSIVDIGIGDPKDDPRLSRPDTDLHTDPIMRPIDPKQNAIIYKGIPYFGRKVYLKSRHKMLPENKFYFTQSGSTEHGWRLKDSYFSKNSPQYARVCRLTRDVMSRSGPHPDPPHYGSSDEPTNQKCTS
ncbi:unnamed protein product [Arctia plantaginis]|uniref:Sperm microtubule inner protein 1 C-terminal domain-containing protein n=1 Tax=Arctia plantaginis TaxID=874455 RepID=A0A8S1AE29_ARCPL|nr:unnamed protein product [Arctia plantaginis]CAB3260636.1 unnamed protein product [Arctia plantaginis]